MKVTRSGVGGTAPWEPCADNRAPVANPGEDKTGQPGSVIEFDGRASHDPDVGLGRSGRIRWYEWQFGDGYMARGATVTHTYQTPGDYTVTLIVGDGCDAVSTPAVLSTVITEGGQCDDSDTPVAVAYADPIGEVGAPVAFDGTDSFDPDGSIVEWYWDFGDGHTGSAATMTHVYGSAGWYVATLVVTDNCGRVSTGDYALVEITESAQCNGNSAPFAIASGDASAETGETVGFDGSGSFDGDGWITAWFWNFGDGSTGSGAFPTHIYQAAGDYTVTLTVTDDCGAADTDTMFVTISEPPCAGNQPPFADAGSDQQAEAGQTLTFDGSGSFDGDGWITAWFWNFGDGSTGSGQTVTHTYSQPASYTVTLTVTDDCGATDTDTMFVTISELPCAGNQPPVADAGSDQQAEIGQPVTFDGSGSLDIDGSIVDYAWDFGDGETGSGPTMTHTYALAGLYVVTLIVTDNCGAANADILSVQVAEVPCAQNQPPVANVGPDQEAETGQTVAFDGGGSFDSDGSIVAWSWTFGDGSTGSGQSVTHTYSEPASYTVTLTVTDDCGATDSDTQVMTITDPGGGGVDPELIGFVPGLGKANDVAVIPGEDRAFIASEDFGLAIVDTTDPANPFVESVLRDGFPSPGVIAASGNVVLLGGPSQTTSVVDISNRGAPFVVATISPGANDLGIHGSYGYVGGGLGLNIVDLSVPDSPEVIGSVSGVLVRGLAVADAGNQTYAYVASAGSGLRVIDVTNPESPFLVTTLDTAGIAADVVLDPSGTHAYVGDSTHLLVINIETPTSPFIEGSLPIGNAVNVTVTGTHVIVASPAYSEHKIKVIDVSTPSNPQLTGTLSVPWVTAAAPNGGFVYVPTGANGLSIVSLADPASPSLEGSLDSGMALRYTIATSFIAGYGMIGMTGGPSSMVEVVDLRDQADPGRIAAIPFVANDLGIHGSYGYIGGGLGLDIVDLSVPGSPEVIGSVSGVLVRGLAVADAGNQTYAYVASAGSGLRVIDVTNPESPFLVTTLDTAGIAADVVLDPSGTRAYVGDSTHLLVINIETPTSPFIEGSLPIGNAVNVTVTGTHVIVVSPAYSEHKIKVIDVGNPSDPQLRGTLGVPWVATAAPVGELVFAATGRSGLAVISIANPEAPELVASHLTPGESKAVAVDPSGLVCLADNAALVALFDPYP